MPYMLILEDDLKDLRIATDIALKAGFCDVLAHNSSGKALIILGNAIEDGKPLPDAIVLDLDLGLESGFEVLRFCHKNRLIPRIPVVVWTVLGEQERKICQLFGIHSFIPKQHGPDALYQTLLGLHSIPPGRPAIG